MAFRNPKPWRCNYCQKAATRWWQYVGYLATRRIKRISLWVATCDDHVHCAQWFVDHKNATEYVKR